VGRSRSNPEHTRADASAINRYTGTEQQAAINHGGGFCSRRSEIHPRLLRRLLYPMAGDHPADRPNRQPGACKNSQWMSAASIWATESPGSEQIGDAPGDSVLR
jgi:hypothetical protein